MRYFKIASNFTRLTTHEITYNNSEILLVVFMPNITTNHAITYTNNEYITCNFNKTTCFMSFCQLSCLMISTENLFVNLGDVERTKSLCFIISLGPTSLEDKRANNRSRGLRKERSRFAIHSPSLICWGYPKHWHNIITSDLGVGN